MAQGIIGAPVRSAVLAKPPRPNRCSWYLSLNGLPMPLNPSGNTPTTSPAFSRRSASAGCAGTCPLLRATLPRPGTEYTRSAPSSLRLRASGCWSSMPTCSMIASSGSTPEWFATTKAEPYEGTFSTPRSLTRNQRLLGADLVYSVPGLGKVARKSGHVPAHPAEAERLLNAGEVVGVFPEGFKGIGKPFSDRYQLQRFGRGGFARTALRTGAPMIPCAIVGAEEIYPMVADLPELAARLKLPYFPITPLFPWFGLIGAIPLPSKWIIEFCDPVPTDGFTTDQCEDQDVIRELADKVKYTIAAKIDELLAERGPAFGS